MIYLRPSTRRSVMIVAATLCLSAILAQAQPTITSLSPTSGPVGSSVVITGTNFSATPANNVVYFGAVKGTVTVASATSLTVTVPAGATGDLITVTTGNLTAFSSLPFYVTFNNNGNLTTSSFATKVNFTVGTWPNDAAIKDLDGDGKADMMVTNFNNGTGTTFSVLRNTATTGSAISFAAKADVTTENGPAGIAAGDLDGDGKPDVVVCHSGSTAEISAFRNTSTVGNISFATRQDFVSGTSCLKVHINDVDVDGKPDLVVYRSQSVEIYRNTSTVGNISFDAKIDFATTISAQQMALGDLDGDRKPDLAISNYNTTFTDPQLTLFLNTSTAGSISFAAGVDFNISSGIVSVGLGDMNNDSKLDIAVLNIVEEKVYIFKNTSTVGSLSLDPYFDLARPTCNTITFADLNGDAKPEMIMNDGNPNRLSVYKNTSTSSISFAAQVSPDPSTNMSRMVVGDLNGDGLPEVTGFNNTASTTVVSVFRNLMAEPDVDSFLPTTASTGTAITITGSNFTGATGVSFGGVACPTFTVNSPTSITAIVDAGASGSVQVTSNAGTGSLAGFVFTPGPTITSFAPEAGPIGTSVTITGTNFNGTPANNTVYFGSLKANVTAASPTSLTVTVPSGSDYLPLTVTTGSLTAYAAKPFHVTFSSGIPFATASIGSFVSHTTGTNPQETASGDLNGDGKADLVVVNQDANTISVFRNTTSGSSVTFATKVDLATATTPNGVAIGDLTGDGKLDVAVINTNFTVSIFKNTSSGGTLTLAAKEDHPADYGVNISIHDIDDDGRPDIVTAGRFITGNYYASVLRNISGEGTLAFSLTNYMVGNFPHGLTVNDFDGDGKDDIATTAMTDDTFTLLRNTSTAGVISFAGKVDFPTPVEPYRIASGDLNNDGKPEIVVGSFGGSSPVAIFPNTSTSGTFSFASSVNLPLNGVHFGVEYSDIDGDGKIDLGVATTTGVSFFRSTTSGGTITFDAPIAVGAWTDHLLLTDLDNDGKQDIAATRNSSANSLSVARNQINEPNVVSFTPATGAIGTTVTITGINFTGTTGVSFGGTAASSFTVVSPTSITAVVGNGTSGSVSVTSPAGTGSKSGFTFDNAPIVSSFTPTSAGLGMTVTITGQRFTGATSVSFGGTAATSFSVVSATSITAVVPAGTSGSVSVTTSYGTHALAGFTFVNAPEITSFTPTSGSTGNTISITGTALSGATAVSFGGNPATFTVNSSTSITATVDVAVSGNVSVTTPGGTGTLAGFTFIPAPKITSLTPASGPVGSAVVIAGENFAGSPAGNTVYFGSVKASVNAATTSSLNVTAPAGATYAPVSITTGALTAQSAPFKFTFAATGAISPNWLQNIGSYPTEASPRKGAMGDLNLDGKTDVAVVNNDDVVSVFPNTSADVISFGTRADYIASASPQEVKFSDLDGDGKLDMIISNYNFLMHIYRNTSTGAAITFAPSINLSSDPGNHMTISDLDGDGRPDIITVGFFSGGGYNVTIRRNITPTNGTITFAPKINYPVGSNLPFTIIAEDVDGDGKNDLILANVVDDNVAILRNTSTLGNISMAAKIDFASGIDQGGMELGDVDGDGKVDLVLSDEGNKISVYRNTSTTGTFAFAPRIDMIAPANARYLSLNDFDGDGKLDIAAGGNSVISFFRNNTAGALSFEPKVDHTIAGNGLLHLTSGDLDNNGKPDFAVIRNVTGEFLTFKNQIGEPVITSFTPIKAGTGSTVTIAGENFTGTTAVSFGGTPAISFTIVSPTSITAVVGGGATGSVSVTTDKGTAALTGFSYYNGPIIVAVSHVSAMVGTPVTIIGEKFSSTASDNFVRFGAALAEVTSATPSELVVKVPAGTTHQPITVTTANLTAYGKPLILSFAGPIALSASSYSPKADFTTATNPEGVVIADFDGDGKSDLATVNSSNTVSVLQNTASGGSVSFAGKLDLDTGETPVSISTSDFNGDGKLDIVVANSSASTVSVFRNSGIGGSLAFGFNVDYTVSTNPQSVATGDLDGDGKPDIVTANFTGSNKISILKNTTNAGAISFAPKVDLTSGSFPSSVSIGDLDADGKPELVVANAVDNTISVFKNTSTIGAISFADRVNYTTGNFPTSIAIGDVSTDGKPDLVVANSSSASVSVFINSGTSFFSKVDYTTGNNPSIVSVGDLNGDGRIDIATANRSSSANSVSVLRNSGGTSFVSKVDYAVGTEPSSVAIGDVNGEGIPDLVSANFGSSNVSVLKSAQPVLTSFSPNKGGAGTTITITGLNLTGATAVSFGATFAVSFNVVSPTTITAVVGTGSSGTVSVMFPGNAVSLPGFTFLAPPTITSFTPNSAGAGATVTLTGTNFTDASAVSFGGTAATSFTVVSPTNATAVVGGGTSGAVSLTTPGGTATLTGFTFIPAPVITSFSPTTGGPGTTVVITGTNFANASSVSFGGIAAASFTLGSATRIEAVVGAGASGSISVSTPAGTGSIAGFTFDENITGIEYGSNSAEFAFWPNPSNGKQLNMYFGSSWHGKPAQLEIFDMTGKKIAASDITCETVTTWENKNEPLGPGIYILSVQRNNRKVVRKMMVGN